MFMRFHIFDVSVNPETNYTGLWRLRITANNTRINPESFLDNIICGNIKMLEIVVFANFGKDTSRKIRKIRLIHSCES